MAALLFILCLLSFTSGVLIMAAANSAIHEILGGVSFINASVLLIGSAIVDSINKVSRQLKSRFDQDGKEEITSKQ
ncbi:MAG: hypothetical protein AB7S78_09130 [Candidatus Omnitrophota bacterium]